MKSDLPKVLHELNGEPLIRIVLKTLSGQAFDRTIVVVGYKGDLVQAAMGDFPVEIVWQREQLGTGHAVLMTRPLLEEFDGTTLVTMGDMPLLSTDSISRLFEAHQRHRAAATCLSAVMDDPTGYGRIVRHDDSDLLEEIVEEKDASPSIRAINEVNTGLFCFDNRTLFATLAEVTNDNEQREYYLTDTVKIMRRKGLPVAVVTAADSREGQGVNSLTQLELIQRRQAKRSKRSEFGGQHAGG